MPDYIYSGKWLFCQAVAAVEGYVVAERQW